MLELYVNNVLTMCYKLISESYIELDSLFDSVVFLLESNNFPHSNAFDDSFLT